MKTLFFALGAVALVGCSSLRPVGPFAKEAPIIQQGKPIQGTTDPTPPPPLRPTPPTMLVVPADVSINPNDAANKLASELSADSKPATNGPVTVEVSRVKGGIK